MVQGGAERTEQIRAEAAGATYPLEKTVGDLERGFSKIFIERNGFPVDGFKEFLQRAATLRSQGIELLTQIGTPEQQKDISQFEAELKRPQGRGHYGSASEMADALRQALPATDRVSDEGYD